MLSADVKVWESCQQLPSDIELLVLEEGAHFPGDAQPRNGQQIRQASKGGKVQFGPTPP